MARGVDFHHKRDWLFAAEPSAKQPKVHTDRDGHWVPACGGTETPFKARSGVRLLYCWHTGTGRHAYLNLDEDRILSDTEALQHLDKL